MNNYPIFVYGTLMKNERAFGLLAHASLRSLIAQLPGALLYASPHGYPLAAEVSPAEDQSPTVVGEVHWLRTDEYPTLLVRLDHYEGDEYIRELRSVQLMDTLPTSQGSLPSTDHLQALPPVDLTTVQAWVYLSDGAYAAQYPLINSGNWRKRGE